MANDNADYQQRIVINPEVMVGKPVIKVTRIPVELVLRHLAQSPDLAELYAAYPHLTLEDVKACLAYAQAVVEGEDVYPEIQGGARPLPETTI
jgi:uncharacterized protein (DUF433 family)